MRAPTAERRRPFRLRRWLIGVVVLLVILLLSLRGLAGFYTDYLWFDSIGQGGTWSNLLAAKVAPALVFTVVFFVILLVNLIIADRIAPKYRSMGPEDEWIARYQQLAGPYTGRIRIGVSLFFALIAGVGVSSQWKQWVLFTHRVDFGTKDPQFHKDIGFYVFQLPFLKFISEWLFAGLVIVFIVTAVQHYLNGGIRFQSPFQRVTPQVKAHLSVILAVMALVKTAQYYLGRYELDFSSRGVVNGAGYTDVKAQLPALNLLVFISVVAAALFLWNIRRRGWVLPIIAVGLWGFVSLVVGTIYPALVQEFKVGPNEFQAEQKYIARNISATRAAMGLDKVDTQTFNFTSFQNLSPGDAQTVVQSNLPTLDNARLWDPNVIQSTYSTLQGLQTYYQIGDVDVDRYMINNQIRQVLIAARGLNSADLPSQSFVNRHIVYTHGYGVVASSSNTASSDGSPDFLLSNIPTSENGIRLSGQAAEIYFGEGLSSYVLVDAQSSEFNYQSTGKNDTFTRYKGKDGVKLSNIFRRAAFALRFGDFNPLISGQVSSSTKVLMERDITARVKKLAPFLRFDADPYPVALGNHTVWVLDGYTTTDDYPYGQSTTGTGGLASEFNYVRNSVKATVDAYDGTVTFYVFDPKDPMIRAWRKAFPDLFTDASKMPADLRAHLRYPEDLFKAQSAIFGRYHVTESKRFYEASAKWLVSPDPGSGSVANTALALDGTQNTTAQTNQPRAASSTGKRMDPYYLYMKVPGDTSEHFTIVEPFVPVSSGNSQTRLVSFLTAKSDPSDYGQLQAFVMPQGQNVFGPSQVDNEFNRTSQISQALTLLGQANSSVITGSMQLIPVGNSIVYARPFYVRATGQNGFPKFQFVALFTQDKGAVCAPTVDGALAQLFSGAPLQTTCGITTAAIPTPASPSTTTTTTTTPSTTAPAGGQTVQSLINQAVQAYNDAQTALKNGDFATYAQKIQQVGQLLSQAQQLQGGARTSSATSGSSP